MNLSSVEELSLKKCMYPFDVALMAAPSTFDLAEITHTQDKAIVQTFLKF